MQVIGFNFKKIQAEKKNLSKDKLTIDSNVNIQNITEEKIEAVKDKPVLKFDFNFIVNYKPDVAEIKLQGMVLLMVEKDQSKMIFKKWKNKEVLEEIRVPLFNLILTKCNLKALMLEEELSLPTHIPLPRIKPQQNNTNYTG